MVLPVRDLNDVRWSYGLRASRSSSEKGCQRFLEVLASRVDERQSVPLDWPTVGTARSAEYRHRMIGRAQRGAVGRLWARCSAVSQLWARCGAVVIGQLWTRSALSARRSWPILGATRSASCRRGAVRRLWTLRDRPILGATRSASCRRGVVRWLWALCDRLAVGTVGLSQNVLQMASARKTCTLCVEHRAPCTASSSLSSPLD